MGERAWESNAEWGGLQAIASGLGKSVPQPQLHVLWDAQLVTATGVTVQTLHLSHMPTLTDGRP